MISLRTGGIAIWACLTGRLAHAGPRLALAFDNTLVNQFSHCAIHRRAGHAVLCGKILFIRNQASRRPVAPHYSREYVRLNVSKSLRHTRSPNYQALIADKWQEIILILAKDSEHASFF